MHFQAVIGLFRPPWILKTNGYLGQLWGGEYIITASQIQNLNIFDQKCHSKFQNFDLCRWILKILQKYLETTLLLTTDDLNAANYCRDNIID